MKIDIETINDWDIRVVHKNKKDIGKLSFRELFRLITENIVAKEKVEDEA